MKQIKYQINLILQDILEFHRDLENSVDYPAEKGLRDLGLLESSVNAPFQTFGGQYLYPTIIEKAAHLLYGLNKNHGFIDGNKRVAIHATLVYLIMNHVNIKYTQDEIVQLSMSVASDKATPADIVEWIQRRITSTSDD